MNIRKTPKPLPEYLQVKHFTKTKNPKKKIDHPVHLLFHHFLTGNIDSVILSSNRGYFPKIATSDYICTIIKNIRTTNPFFSPAPEDNISLRLLRIHTVENGVHQEYKHVKTQHNKKKINSSSVALSFDSSKSEDIGQMFWWQKIQEYLNITANETLPIPGFNAGQEEYIWDNYEDKNIYYEFSITLQDATYSMICEKYKKELAEDETVKSIINTLIPEVLSNIVVEYSSVFPR